MEKTTYVNFPRKQGEDEEALPKYILKELMKTRQESEGKNWDTGENKQDTVPRGAGRDACLLPTLS